MQGRPGSSAGDIFHSWAQLPISKEQYFIEQTELQKLHFPTTKPLAGVEKLLEDLGTAKVSSNGKWKVHIALATSSHASNFKLKTDHLQELFSVFSTDRRVLGDDERIAKGRGKPLPDIYHLALKTINTSLPEGEPEVKPEECLVFEDSVPGVEAGRRAGMRVIWCPHPELANEYLGREAEVLAGRTGEGGDVDLHDLGEIGDGWAEYLKNLKAFPYERYGIVVEKEKGGEKI